MAARLLKLLALLLLLGAVVPAGRGRAGTVRLSELETAAGNSLEVREAEALLEETKWIEEGQRARNGLKAFGNAGVGRYREPTSEDTIWLHDTARGEVGLSYPLLGSRERETLALLRARGKTEESRFAAELARRKVLAAMREQYITWWAAGCKERIAAGFLSFEREISALLSNQARAGRLLDADRREFMSSFDLARRESANAKASRDRAVRALALLSGRDLAGLTPTAPDLPEARLNETPLLQAIRTEHPELLALRQGLRDSETAAEQSRWRDVEASLDAAAQSTYSFPGGSGLGGTVGLTVRVPLDILDSRLAAREAERAEARRRSLAVERRQEELVIEARDGLSRMAIAVENMRFAYARVSAAAEAMRERQLRVERIPGDTLEKLQQARAGFFMASLDAADAEAQRMLALARLAGMAPATTARPAANGDAEKRMSLLARGLSDPEARQALITVALPSPEQVRIPESARGWTGVYIWAPDLSSRQAISNLLDGARRAGFDRLLVSLTREQLDAVSAGTGEDTLHGLLGEASDTGMRVDLLLGDPAWALTEHRGGLIEIIRSMSRFDFRSVHLDIEPEQLGCEGQACEQAVLGLLDTVRAVREISPWPVGISVHPRMLLDLDRDAPVGRAFLASRPDEVALMIYSANLPRVVEVAGRIMEAFPETGFSVAQSVESDLPAEESLFRMGRRAYRERLATLRDRLDRTNFLGTITQSWENVRMMEP